MYCIFLGPSIFFGIQRFLFFVGMSLDSDVDLRL